MSPWFCCFKCCRSCAKSWCSPRTYCSQMLSRYRSNPFGAPPSSLSPAWPLSYSFIMITSVPIVRSASRLIPVFSFFLSLLCAGIGGAPRNPSCCATAVSGLHRVIFGHDPSSHTKAHPTSPVTRHAVHSGTAARCVRDGGVTTVPKCRDGCHACSIPLGGISNQKSTMEAGR